MADVNTVGQHPRIWFSSSQGEGQLPCCIWYLKRVLSNSRSTSSRFPIIETRCFNLTVNEMSVGSNPTYHAEKAKSATVLNESGLIL